MDVSPEKEIDIAIIPFPLGSENDDVKVIQDFTVFLPSTQRGRKGLTLSSVKVFLQPKKKDGQIGTTGLTLKVNNVAVPAGMWGDFGENMRVSEVTIAGTPFMKWTIDAGIEGLDIKELGDVLLLIKYTAS